MQYRYGYVYEYGHDHPVLYTDVTSQRSWVKSEISIVALATSNHCKDETIKCTQTYPEWICALSPFSHNSLKLECSINSGVKNSNLGCVC